MLHKDAREETSCEKLRAGMGVEEPHWMSRVILSPHIRKPVRRMDSPGVFRTGRSSIGCVVRPSYGLFVHGACWAFIGRVIRPWDGLGVHGTCCSSIGRFEWPYGAVSSWRYHALPCSGEAALAAQRCWNAALYPLSLPWQRRSLHFDRHVSRRHSAIFPFYLGKSFETGTICTQRSI